MAHALQLLWHTIGLLVAGVAANSQGHSQNFQLESQQNGVRVLIDGHVFYTEIPGWAFSGSSRRILNFIAGPLRLGYGDWRPSSGAIVQRRRRRFEVFAAKVGLQGTIELVWGLCISVSTIVPLPESCLARGSGTDRQ